MIGLKTISDELESKINIYLNLFVILYTDDTVLMAESASEQQTLLDTFYWGPTYNPTVRRSDSPTNALFL